MDIFFFTNDIIYKKRDLGLKKSIILFLITFLVIIVSLHELFYHLCMYNVIYEVVQTS